MTIGSFSYPIHIYTGSVLRQEMYSFAGLYYVFPLWQQTFNNVYKSLNIAHLSFDQKAFVDYYQYKS